MEENKKKEELQSRRGFFKDAAKKALPILAAVALANVPQIMKAAEANGEMGCSYCEGKCMASCKGTCSGGCKGSCKYECSGGCKGGCRNTCKNSCVRSNY